MTKHRNRPWREKCLSFFFLPILFSTLNKLPCVDPTLDDIELWSTVQIRLLIWVKSDQFGIEAYRKRGRGGFVRYVSFILLINVRSDCQENIDTETQEKVTRRRQISVQTEGNRWGLCPRETPSMKKVSIQNSSVSTPRKSTDHEQYCPYRNRPGSSLIFTVVTKLHGPPESQ